MRALRTALESQISVARASRSSPWEATLPGGVDISITLSLDMASELCEPRGEEIAHAHHVIAGGGWQCGELIQS